MHAHRYGLVWRIAALFPLLLAISLPVLMLANHERFDVAIILLIGVLALAGVWSYFYVLKYAVAITPDGLTVYRLAHQPCVVAWREVTSVQERNGSIMFQTARHQKISISSHFPGYSAVVSAVAGNLPDVVFENPSERPAIEPEPRDHESWRLIRLARRRFWLRLAFRLFIGAGLLLGGAFLAETALGRLDFHAMPHVLAVIVSFLLSFLQSWGYGMSVWLLVLSLLSLIMSLQENVRLRRLPPAA
jgi:hypothetical protein